jgi:hypothetical protein
MAWHGKGSCLEWQGQLSGVTRAAVWSGKGSCLEWQGQLSGVRVLERFLPRPVRCKAHLVAALRPLVVAPVLLLQVARVGPGEGVVLVADVCDGGVIPGVVLEPVPVEVREVGVGVGVADVPVTRLRAILPAGGG